MIGISMGYGSERVKVYEVEFVGPTTVVREKLPVSVVWGKRGVC